MFEDKENKTIKKIYWGTVLIGLGGLLLSRNLGLLPFEMPAPLVWKLILLAIGLSLLIVKRKIVGGVIVTTIASVLILSHFAYLPHLDFHTYWPIILIMCGIATLFKRNHSFKKKEWRMREPSTSNENFMEATAIFAGESKKISSFDFKGGKITTIFGGMELDLTNCYLTNEKAEIEIMAVCGGVSLKVPKEWNVRSEIAPIMGGIEDKINKFPSAYVDPAALLILKGTVVMGGIEIKRA